MSRVGRVAGEIFLGPVAAVEDVGELEGGGPVPVKGTSGEVLDHVERSETIEAAEHGGKRGVVSALFDVEEDDVLDGGGGHSDVGGSGGGERLAAEEGAEGSEVGDCWGFQ